MLQLKWTRGKGILAEGATRVVRYKQGSPCGRNWKKHGLHWESGCGHAGDEAAELGGFQIMLGLVIHGKEGSSLFGYTGRLHNGQCEQ